MYPFKGRFARFSHSDIQQFNQTHKRTHSKRRKSVKFTLFKVDLVDFLAVRYNSLIKHIKELRELFYDCVWLNSHCEKICQINLKKGTFYRFSPLALSSFMCLITVVSHCEKICQIDLKKDTFSRRRRFTSKSRLGNQFSETMSESTLAWLFEARFKIAPS